MMIDSHGLFTGTATEEENRSFVIDVALGAFSPVLSKSVTNVMGSALTSISKDKTIVQTTMVQLINIVDGMWQYEANIYFSYKSWYLGFDYKFW